MAESETKSLGQIARELGIDVETLRLWRRAESTANGEPTDTPNRKKTSGVVLSLEEENRRLKRENARVLEEREILKKATAFFARDAR